MNPASAYMVRLSAPTINLAPLPSEGWMLTKVEAFEFRMHKNHPLKADRYNERL